MKEKLSILIVDDHSPLVDSLTLTLEWDYDIIGFDTPSCGHAVLDWIKTNPKQPDLAIIDILIYGISGHDIAHAIRNKGWTCKIIFLTGCEPSHDKYKKVEQFISSDRNSEICRKKIDTSNSLKIPHYFKQLMTEIEDAHMSKQTD